MPRLTIGLITYNGANQIRRSIESLLGQSFTDFELVIFDNASTDGTSAICEDVARRDPRVRHVRHPQTIPQSANFRGVLMAAKTELFMWATDDDVWEKGFAAGCIAELDRHPEAVSACMQVRFRTAEGRDYPARGTFTITGTSEQRVKRYLSNPRDSARLYGVYRTAALQRAYPREVNVFGYDWLVVCLTMLEGDHREVEGIGLTRAANPPGKYFERYSRHFVRDPGLLGQLSYILPLAPLTRELRAALPASAWRAARGKILRLNLHQMLLFLKWKYPILESLFVALRRVDRALDNS